MVIVIAPMASRVRTVSSQVKVVVLILEALVFIQVFLHIFQFQAYFWCSFYDRTICNVGIFNCLNVL